MAEALRFVKLSLLPLPHLSLSLSLSPFSRSLYLLSPSHSLCSRHPSSLLPPPFTSTAPTTSAGSLSPLIRRLRLPPLLHLLLPPSSSSPHPPHPPSFHPFTTSLHFPPSTLSLSPFYSLYIFPLSPHPTHTHLLQHPCS